MAVLSKTNLAIPCSSADFLIIVSQRIKNIFYIYFVDILAQTTRIDKSTEGHRFCSLKERQGIIKERCKNQNQPPQNLNYSYDVLLISLKSILHIRTKSLLKLGLI